MRHGQVENRNKLAGQANIELSDTGKQQMKQALDKVNIKRCISSPLSRCQTVSKQWCENNNIPFSVEACLQEYNFGDWDGQHFDSLWAMSSPNIGDFWQAPEKITPPNGESYQQFHNRVGDWWQNYIRQISEQDDCTVIVTHAGVIKRLIAQVLQVNNSAELINQLTIGYSALIKISVCIDGNKRWLSLSL